MMYVFFKTNLLQFYYKWITLFIVNIALSLLSPVDTAFYRGVYMSPTGRASATRRDLAC